MNVVLKVWYLCLSRALYLKMLSFLFISLKLQRMLWAVLCLNIEFLIGLKICYFSRGRIWLLEDICLYCEWKGRKLYDMGSRKWKLSASNLYELFERCLLLELLSLSVKRACPTWPFSPFPPLWSRKKRKRKKKRACPTTIRIKGLRCVWL